ncbi:MAG: nucleotidyl transferase AbiEii/AbiGii toxin family protein [Gemmataceae bacterium]|nr:nucleotidyl transferase AbiEii/AbiGii toxin family protein [Gemmataceae bacterium]
MKLAFLELSADERRPYIEQAATQRNISPVILEKDFWVCWLLGVLFQSEFAGNLVFKGGTSLSKVFGVIQRFSEDIDLSLSPVFLKLPWMWKGVSGKRRQSSTRNITGRPTHLLQPDSRAITRIQRHY